MSKGNGMSSKGPVLILGFPSEIAHAVSSLLLDSGHTVHLIVAQDDFSQAAKLKKRFGKQLQLLPGSGDSLDFALSGSDYLDLAERVEYVLSLYPDEDVKHADAFCSALAREIVEFCKVAKRVRRVFYLSGFSFVAGFSGVVAEKDLVLPIHRRSQEALPSFRIERVLQRFQQSFPISIVRCGTVVGKSERLCPLVMLALGFPELFSKHKSGKLLITDVEMVTHFLVEALSFSEIAGTIHLFSDAQNTKTVGVQLAQLALSQVPRTYDLRTAARRKIRKMGYDAKRLSSLQTTANIENTWTKQLLKAHNFSQWDQTMNWNPLVEHTVDSLTGFQ